jgi:predicted Zn-dependent protease
MLRKCALLLSWGVAAACAAHAPPVQPTPAEAAEAASKELFDQGSRLARQGDSVRAEQYLAAALREGHDPEQALPLLMRVCLLESRLGAALNHATPYLKKHPDAVWLRYLVATVYLGLEQPQRAKEHLLLIEMQSPKHGRTQYLLGLTEWEGFKNRAATEAHFREYLRLEPRGPHAPEIEEWLRSQTAATVAVNLDTVPIEAVPAQPQPSEPVPYRTLPAGQAPDGPVPLPSAPLQAPDSRKPAP